MEHKKRNRTRIIIISAVCLVLLIIAVWLLIPYIKQLAEPAFQEEMKVWIESMGISGWLLLFGIQMIQIIIAFIPGEPVEILSGALYGAWGGALICLLGCLTATVIIFSISKTFGRPLINKLFGEERVKSWNFLQSSKQIETIVFVLFLIPGTPKDMLTYIAGFGNIKLSRFLIISTLARIPSILSSTIMGSTMKQGEWGVSIFMFIASTIIGIIAIKYQNQILELCKKMSNHRKERHHHL